MQFLTEGSQAWDVDSVESPDIVSYTAKVLSFLVALWHQLCCTVNVVPIPVESYYYFCTDCYSVELIQPRCVLLDEAYVTQLLSCRPTEGQLSINCLCHVFRICTSKEGTNSTCFCPKLQGTPRISPRFFSGLIDLYLKWWRGGHFKCQVTTTNN